MTRALQFLLPAFIFASLFLSPVAAWSASQGKILGKEGNVDFAAGPAAWSPAVIGQSLNVADQVRTLARSRAMLQLAELGRLRVNELTTLEILPPRDPAGKATLDLKAGAMYFFTRDKPREFQIQTPYAVAASRGTEFTVTVDADGTSHYVVFDGEVGVTNALGGILLMPREAGKVEPGQAPVKTAVIEARDIVQWWLYYPGVVDLGDLALTAAETNSLAVSLADYRAGDLLGALANYPAGRVAQSDDEQTYFAGLLLAVGQVAKADLILNPFNTLPAANALRQVIAATNLRPYASPRAPATASEWLAGSYTLQARFDLAGALKSARTATELSPQFGFAWERVAELEFSFGRRETAQAALAASLKLSPRNAEAWVLQGFLAAADDRLAEARAAFQKAIDLDNALGNAWLGRGLLRFRQGEPAAGLADLATAAAMEPNQSVLHSYLGKAFGDQNQTTNSFKELRLARELDPSDPTPWLYSALLLRQQLRFNQSVDDLEESVTLNDNRRVYRSRMRLDQDLAVRSASLATIYQDAGMDDVSVREAARAVDYDYNNYSAHLFLSDSYNALRDPTDFNLRYDTAWLNELLLANLLAPAGVGVFAQNVSQHEYASLFESDRIGLNIESDYDSQGQYIQKATQYGNFGDTSYTLDLDYRHYDGVRPNNELDRIEWISQIKQQLTKNDSVMLFTEYRNYNSGDNNQYYYPTNAHPNFNYSEQQEANVLVGYRHEWTPDNQTLFLGGWLPDISTFSDKNTSQSALTTNGAAVISANPLPPIFDYELMTHFQIMTLELSQIVQDDHERLIAGCRFQAGDFHTTDEVTLSPDAPFPEDYPHPPAAGDATDTFRRFTAYAYYTLELFTNFSLTAGVAYDGLTYPADFRSPPTFSGSEWRDQVSPKAALVWSINDEVTLRCIYAQSLGGVSYDQSYRLEPTELAGFVQSFGSIIPESIVGSVSAPSYQIIGGAVDVKLKSHTYFGVQVEVLNADVDQQQGVFASGPSLPPQYLPANTTETLNFQETSATVSVNQLLSDTWSIGTSFRYTDAQLHDVFPAIEPFYPPANSTTSANLLQNVVFVAFNHPSGFFTRLENQWYYQENSGYSPAEPSSDFCQQNFLIGWRFKRQRGEISFGLLNISDQSYHLNPLTLYSEMPQERTYAGSVKFNF